MTKSNRNEAALGGPPDMINPASLVQTNWL